MTHSLHLQRYDVTRPRRRFQQPQSWQSVEISDDHSTESLLAEVVLKVAVGWLAVLRSFPLLSGSRPFSFLRRTMDDLIAGAGYSCSCRQHARTAAAAADTQKANTVVKRRCCWCLDVALCLRPLLGSPESDVLMSLATCRCFGLVGHQLLRILRNPQLCGRVQN